jgi:hypothetical protein
MQSTDVKLVREKYGLMSEQDEHIANHLEGHTRWVVKLSNGLHIYQDDFRLYSQFTDEREYSTWTRLRDYCKQENVNITDMWIQFRTNREFLPSNADGYYFCKCALGAFGTTQTFHMFVTGWVENNIIKIKKWQIPELVLTEELNREIKDDDICLIMNNRNNL